MKKIDNAVPGFGFGSHVFRALLVLSAFLVFLGLFNVAVNFTSCISLTGLLPVFISQLFVPVSHCPLVYFSLFFCWFLVHLFSPVLLVPCLAAPLFLGSCETSVKFYSWEEIKDINLILLPPFLLHLEIL